MTGSIPSTLGWIGDLGKHIIKPDESGIRDHVVFLNNRPYVFSRTFRFWQFSIRNYTQWIIKIRKSTVDLSWRQWLDRSSSRWHMPVRLRRILEWLWRDSVPMLYYVLQWSLGLCVIRPSWSLPCCLARFRFALFLLGIHRPRRHFSVLQISYLQRLVLVLMSKRGQLLKGWHGY
jgi:hypothetical protein